MYKFLLSMGLLTLSCASFAATNWTGQAYGIMPKHDGVTTDYCIAHAFNTYQTNMNTRDKEVIAANGVKTKDMGYSTREVGGLYFRNGTAIFSGVINGTEWQEKVYYFSQALLERGGAEQGVWYTKDCKGFFKVGPDAAM